MPVSPPNFQLLSDLTGADEDPLDEGGNWQGPFGVDSSEGELRRVTNAARVGTVKSFGQSAWIAGQHDANGGFVGTLKTAPVGGSGRAGAVWGRIHNPGTSTAEAYLYVYTDGIGHRLFKMSSDGSFAQLDVQASPALADGDRMWIDFDGTTISGRYYQVATGVWEEAVSVIDAEISGAGYGGFEISAAPSAADPEWDDAGFALHYVAVTLGRATEVSTAGHVSASGTPVTVTLGRATTSSTAPALFATVGGPDFARLVIPRNWTHVDTSNLFIDRGKNSIDTDNANAYHVQLMKDLAPAGWRLAHHNYLAGTAAAPSDPPWAGSEFEFFMDMMNTLDPSVRFLYGYNGGPQPRPTTADPMDPTNIPTDTTSEGSPFVMQGFVTKYEGLYPGRMEYEGCNEPGTASGSDGSTAANMDWYATSDDAAAWWAVHLRQYLNDCIDEMSAGSLFSFSGGFAQSAAYNSAVGSNEFDSILFGKGIYGTWPAALTTTNLEEAIAAAATHDIAWSQHAYASTTGTVDDRAQSVINRHLYPEWVPGAGENKSGWLAWMKQFRATVDPLGGDVIYIMMSEYEPTTEVASSAHTGSGAIADTLVMVGSWNRSERFKVRTNVLMSVMRDEATWGAWPSGSPATSPGAMGDGAVIYAGGNRIRTPRYFNWRDVLIPFDRLAKKRITVPLWSDGVAGLAADTGDCIWLTTGDLTPATSSDNAINSVQAVVGFTQEEDELWIIVGNAHESVTKTVAIDLPAVPSGSVKSRFDATNGPVTRTDGQMAGGTAGQILYTRVAGSAAVSAGGGVVSAAEATAEPETGAFTISGSTLTIDGTAGTPTLGPWDTILIRVPMANTTVTLGRATDTSSAGAMTVTIPGSIALGRSGETDAARGLGIARRVDIQRATESDSITVLQPSRRLTLGRPATTGTAQAPTAAHGVTLGRPAEVDVALALPRRVTLGRATEATAAMALALAQRLELRRPAEADAARHLLGTTVLDRAMELEQARALAVARRVALGRALEADVARAPVPVAQDAIGRAETTSEARALGAAHGVALGRAATTSTGRALVGGQAVRLGRASTTATGGLGTIRKRAHLGRASEVDRPRNIIRTSRITLGRARDISLIAPGYPAGQSALVPSHRLELGRAADTATARHLRHGQRLTLGRAITAASIGTPTPAGRVNPGRAESTAVAHALDLLVLVTPTRMDASDGPAARVTLTDSLP